MRFQDYLLLLLLPVLPWLIYRYVRMWRDRRVSVIRFPDLGRIKQIAPSASVRLRHVLFGLRLTVLLLLVLAAARPQSGAVMEEALTEGVDIMLTLDISGSMRAEDFKPNNRLHVAKQVIGKFIEGRKNDRMGLVIFASKAFTQCPLTLDYGVLLNFVDRSKIGMIQDGTAIGNAIATAVKRIKDSQGKSKIIVLLTDGVSNAGEIDPKTAAKLAKTYGIKIYTVGAGIRGSALYPVDDPIFGKRYVRLPSELDEDSLMQIASTTGGRYFRATDTDSLKKIFGEIDRMEKTEIEVRHYTRYTDLFWYLMLPALSILVLEVVLANTRFMRIS